MPKIIKLTENDIKNIVNNVIKEQGVPPYPEKRPTQIQERPGTKGVPPYPEPLNRDHISQVNSKVRSEMGVGTNPEILDAKNSVRAQLNDLLHAMKKLLAISGVNPQENDFPGDVEKIVMKFEKLYGNPKPTEKKKMS